MTSTQLNWGARLLIIVLLVAAVVLPILGLLPAWILRQAFKSQMMQRWTNFVFVVQAIEVGLLVLTVVFFA